MRTAAEIARLVADALQRDRLPYAIGGAIALGFYAVPRATLDVDLNVFVSPERDLGRVLETLRSAGFVTGEPDDALRSHAIGDGQFRGTIDGLRVDVFVPAIPYYGELQDRAQQVVLFGRPISILGPEDLVVLKMMFFRRKDLADVEAVLREQGPSLDRAYVRARLASLAGPDSERARVLAEIECDVDRGDS